MLRAGYVSFGVAFLAVAGAEVGFGALLLLALAAALAGGFFLAFSQDDVPKWAGLAILAYFGLTVLAFLASTPVTINKGGGYFVNDNPSAFFADLYDYVVLAFPIMLAATAFAAAWEREAGPRVLLALAGAGAILWAVLSFALVPQGGGKASAVAAAASAQNSILNAVALASAVAGVAGAAWAALRPDEYA